MSESEYTKSATYIGYDKVGFLYTIYEYKKIGTRSKYKTSDNKDVKRISSKQFQIINNGVIVDVK